MIASNLAKYNPKLLIAGLGFPKQETFLHKHKDLFTGTILIGAGGSLDIFAGSAKRAPEIYRKMKIEWLWRMIREPGRFGQLILLIKFCLIVLFRHPSLLKKGIDDKIH